MAWWRRNRPAVTAERAVVSSCDLRVAAAVARRKFDEEGAAGRGDAIRSHHEVWRVFLRFCRVATLEEYMEWLTKFAETHGIESFTYDEDPLGLQQGASLERHFDEIMQWDEVKDYFVQRFAGMYVLESIPEEVPDKFYLRVLVPIGLELPDSMVQNHRSCQLYFMNGQLNWGKAVIFSDVAEVLAA